MRAPAEPQLWWAGAAGGGRRNARPPEMQKRLANAAVCVSRGVRAVARELPTVREPICVCMRAHLRATRMQDSWRHMLVPRFPPGRDIAQRSHVPADTPGIASSACPQHARSDVDHGRKASADSATQHGQQVCVNEHRYVLLGHFSRFSRRHRHLQHRRLQAGAQRADTDARSGPVVISDGGVYAHRIAAQPRSRGTELE